MSESTASRSVLFSCAAAAGPLSPLKPHVRVRAKTVMTPAGLTRTIRHPPIRLAIKAFGAPSATYRLSDASNARYRGSHIGAGSDDVSRLVTVPSGLIGRTRPLNESATYRVPWLSNKRPSGALNPTAVSGPPSP